MKSNTLVCRLKIPKAAGLDSGNPCAVQVHQNFMNKSNTTLLQATLNGDYLFFNNLKADCPFLLERIVRKSKNPNDIPPTSPRSYLGI